MQTITLGEVTLTRVAEWSGPIMPPSRFVPESSPRDWDNHRDWIAPDHWDPEADQVISAVQTWVLRSEGRTILVDTGIGNHKQRPGMAAFHQLDTGFLGNLAAARVRPEEVDVVINTHVHGDHVGWNTRLDGDEWVPTFPNANYLVPERDYAFFDPDGPLVSKSRSQENHANVFEDSITPVHNAGLVQLWDESLVLDKNLRLKLAAGHTPGSSVLRLESGSDRAVFVGDLLHTAVQIAEPGYNSCFCEDLAQARATRHSVLEQAADTNTLVLPAHLAGHGAAHVRRDGTKFAVSAWAPFAKAAS